MPKQKYIEKFVKKDNICNICCKETKGLSVDYVPPKACPPVSERCISKLTYQIVGDKSFSDRFSQSGVQFKTICQKCNNHLGSKYDSQLADLSHKIQSFVETSVHLPDSFEVECFPNAVMRSVLGHILAAKTQTDEVVIDSLIRPCILDELVSIPSDIHIFYWIYPYDKIIILRDFAMPAVRGRFNVPGLFNMLKFYPIAFLIAYKLDAYEGLPNLDSFNNLSVTDKGKLTINLRPAKRPNWPEECLGRENYLLFGRAANDDSVYSLPKK